MNEHKSRKRESRVLVVDDNRDACRMISDILRNYFEEDIRTSISFSGENALKKLNRYNYDLMILDYKLRGISGLEVIEGVKQFNTDIQIIMISGFGDIHKRECTKGASNVLGACAFIDKPLEIGSFVEVVGRALKKKGAGMS